MKAVYFCVEKYEVIFPTCSHFRFLGNVSLFQYIWTFECQTSIYLDIWVPDIDIYLIFGFSMVNLTSMLLWPSNVSGTVSFTIIDKQVGLLCYHFPWIHCSFLAIIILMVRELLCRFHFQDRIPLLEEL